MIVMEIRKERHCHYSSCPKKSSIFCGQAKCVHPNASVNAKAEQLCKYGVRNTRNSKGLQHFSVKIFLWDTNTKNSRKWFKMNSYIRQILNNHRKICTSIIAKGRPPTPPVSALASFENADSESAYTKMLPRGEWLLLVHLTRLASSSLLSLGFETKRKWVLVRCPTSHGAAIGCDSSDKAAVGSPSHSFLICLIWLDRDLTFLVFAEHLDLEASKSSGNMEIQ